MYSVFKYQDLSTSVENKTFSKKEGFISLTESSASKSGSTKTQIKRTKLPVKTGGDDRNRTCDPLNANQVLSQLSYIPKKLVAGTGFEPATFGL